MILKHSLLLGVLFAANAAFANLVEPWPLQNGPNGAPPQPTPAEIAAAQAQQQAEMAAYQQYLQQQQAAAAQQQANGGTGSNELANSFGNMMPGGAGNNRMGTQSLSTPAGNGIADGGSAGMGANGMANRYIDGCSTEPGKFQFKFGHANAEGCDGKIKVNGDLADFLADNLNRCVQFGAKKNVPIVSGKIFHAGFLGDAAHQQTGSLHNYGLAMDLNAIQVKFQDGTGATYDFSKKKDTQQSVPFFQEFRKCWTDSVQKFKSGCLSNIRSGMVGTIGDEDHRHHDHMHLSVPFCNNQRPAGAYMTMAWLFSVAEAAEAPKKDKKEEELMPPPSTFTRKAIKVKGGEIKLTIEDGHGEPVGYDHTITLDVVCQKKKTPAPAPIVLNACDYTDTTYDAKKNEVTVKFRTADMVSGRLSCRIPNTKVYKLPCE